MLTTLAPVAAFTPAINCASAALLNCPVLSQPIPPALALTSMAYEVTSISSALIPVPSFASSAATNADDVIAPCASSDALTMVVSTGVGSDSGSGSGNGAGSGSGSGTTITGSRSG